MEKSYKKPSSHPPACAESGEYPPNILMRPYRIFSTISMVVLFLWAALVLSRYFYVLIDLPWLSLDIQASYRLLTLGARGFVFPILFFILLNLIAIILGRILRSSIGKIIMAELLVATLLLFCLSADPWLGLKALSFFGTLFLMGWGTVFLYRITFKAPIAYWMGLLLSFILIHYYFFAVSLMGAFRLVALLPPILILSGMGCFELWRNGRALSDRIWVFLRDLNWASLLFLQGLWLVSAAGFVAACAPETYSDAMRSHVPFMINLIREGILLPNYYWFAHLQASPLQLLGSGGYLFLGEIGAKWFTFLMGMMAGLLILLEIYHLTQKWSYALGAGFLFLSSPSIWVWLTTNYQDLPSATFLIAGLATFRRAITEREDSLILSGLFFGFAVVSKFYIFVIVFAIILFFLLCFPKQAWRSIKERPKHLLLTFLVFLMGSTPWLVLVWVWTGNPFFPNANDFFKSPYLPPHFLEELKAGAKTLFKFPNGWFDLITWPWSMTFQTKYFGELPNGGGGPFFLIFYPFVLAYTFYGLFQRTQWTSLKMAMVYFFAGLFFIFFLSYLMEIPYLRHWNVGFGVITIGTGIAFSEFMTRHRPTKNWVSIIFVCILISLSLGILLGWGVRLNYGSPDGIGWSLYTGKITEDDYLKKRTGNAYHYVNQHIKEGESIMAVGYEQLNTFRNFTFQLNRWSDRIIGLHQLSDYDHLVQKENVRYWVVKDTYQKGYYADIGVAQKYWKEALLVHRRDGFSVYTTKPSMEPPPPPHKEVQPKSSKEALSSLEGWRIAGYLFPSEKGRLKGRFDTQIYNEFYPPPTASKITGSIFFRSDQDQGAVLCDIIWYQFEREIKRSVAEAISMKDRENELTFYESMPPKATKVVLILRPWRKEDGIITMERVEIRWLE